MKVRHFAWVLCGFCSTALAVDFTPHYLDYFVGDTLKRRLYFQDGAQKIGLKMSGETEVDAFEGGARVRFPALKDASYLLRNSALKLPFDAASLPKYREAALTFLPAAAKEVRITQELNNPLDIFDWTGYRYLLAFTINGRAAQQEITFLNLRPGQQIVLIATAYEADFGEFTQRTNRLIRSWNPLTAADENPRPFN